MIATLNPEKAALLCEWREQCRINLLELEKKSIFVRLSVFEKIINEKTIQVNRMLCIDTDLNQIQPYKHYTDTYQQCKFIENWNGLNTNQMRSLPKSLQEYENRAKNWLNGRRAINYAQNLFPEMILCAEHYATSTANKVFGNDDVCDKCKKDLYGSILLHSYISGICCGRVALYDGHHRASLICENSIKKEGNLKRLLQKYFDGEQIKSYSFPKHLQDAIDYFKNKYHEKLNQYQTRYVHRITATTTSTACHYTNSRGGPHIGSCDKYRNNPLRNHNNNNNESYACMNNVLPPIINVFNDDNYVSNNRQSNSRMCIQNRCPINDIDVDCNLMTKMNEIQCRNRFLEQEIAQFRERQRVDAEKIKLLQEQVTSLLQRQSTDSNTSTNSSIDSIVNSVNTYTQSPLTMNVPLYNNNIREGVCPLSPLSLNINGSSVNSYTFPPYLCNRVPFGPNPSLCGFELDATD